MKQFFKKSIILIIILTMIFSITTINSRLYAADGFTEAKIDTPDDAFTDKVTSDADKFVNNAAKTAVAVVRIASVAIAVVMLLAVSIKYMVSSAGERADIKKHAVVYVVGALVLFGATGILGIISKLADKTFK